MAEKRESYGLHEVERQTEEYCKRLKEQRHSRQEDRSAKKEALRLREENEVLRERLKQYEKLLETSGDPDILRKFFQLEEVKHVQSEVNKETMKELDAKESELTIMKSQYETMRKS